MTPEQRLALLVKRFGKLRGDALLQAEILEHLRGAAANSVHTSGFLQVVEADPPDPAATSSLAVVEKLPPPPPAPPLGPCDGTPTVCLRLGEVRLEPRNLAGSHEPARAQEPSP